MDNLEFLSFSITEPLERKSFHGSLSNVQEPGNLSRPSSHGSLSSQGSRGSHASLTGQGALANIPASKPAPFVPSAGAPPVSLPSDLRAKLRSAKPSEPILGLPQPYSGSGNSASRNAPLKATQAIHVHKPATSGEHSIVVSTTRAPVLKPPLIASSHAAPKLPAAVRVTPVSVPPLKESRTRQSPDTGMPQEPRAPLVAPEEVHNLSMEEGETRSPREQTGNVKAAGKAKNTQELSSLSRELRDDMSKLHEQLEMLGEVNGEADSAAQNNNTAEQEDDDDEDSFTTETTGWSVGKGHFANRFKENLEKENCIPKETQTPPSKKLDLKTETAGSKQAEVNTDLVSPTSNDVFLDEDIANNKDAVVKDSKGMLAETADPVLMTMSCTPEMLQNSKQRSLSSTADELNTDSGAQTRHMPCRMGTKITASRIRTSSGSNSGDELSKSEMNVSSSANSSQFVTDIDKTSFNFASKPPKHPDKLAFHSSVKDLKSKFSLSPNSETPKQESTSRGKERRRSRQWPPAKEGRTKRQRFASQEFAFDEGLSPSSETTPSGFKQPPSRSVSLEQVVCLPEVVPEKLDFRQLEKFEGKY